MNDKLDRFVWKSEDIKILNILKKEVKLKKKQKESRISVKDVIKLSPRIGRAKAVKLHCISCCGGSPSEVTFCNILNCPLWFWRFGVPMTSKSAVDRMEKARKSNPDLWDECFSDLEET